MPKARLKGVQIMPRLIGIDNLQVIHKLVLKQETRTARNIQIELLKERKRVI